MWDMAVGRRDEPACGEQVLPSMRWAPMEKARTAQGETKKYPRTQHADWRCVGPWGQWVQGKLEKQA